MENLYSFIGDPEKEYLPHSVTESEFLERLEAKLYLENNLVIIPELSEPPFRRMRATFKRSITYISFILLIHTIGVNTGKGGHNYDQVS